MTAPYDKSDFKRGFWPFVAMQAQGAFSDNLYRFMMVYLLVRATGAELTTETTGTISGIAGMLFAVPFFIFVSIFGALSDRFSKRTMSIASKTFEVGVMCVAGIGFYTGNPVLLWVTLFFMATQSAQFSPCKYGILPEAIPEHRLSWANGVVQGSTMVAVMAGIGVSGFLFRWLYEGPGMVWAMPILVGCSLFGLTMAFRIFAPPAANPEVQVPLNPYRGLPKYLSYFWKDRWLGVATLTYVFFWSLAMLVNMNLVPFGYVSLGLDEARISYMAAAVSIGIALGALAAGQLSRGRIEPGLVPIGGLGMATCALLLGFHWYSYAGATFLLFLLGFFGGVFDVPVASLMQQRSPAHVRGGLMTVANMFSWIGIASAAGLFTLATRFGVDPETIFLFTSAGVVAFGGFILFAQPLFVLRTVLWLLSNTFYRVRVVGRQNIPETGGALLVANHTSFLDALVITAALDRKIRFVMTRSEYEVPWIKPLARMMGAIPVSAGGGPREVVQSLRSATESLKSGDLVCIFAEGQITRSGQMMPFRKGFDRIMKGVDAPIVPVHVDNIWGTIFRFVDGKFIWRWPDRVPVTITAGFGTPMPSDSNAYQLRAAIQELGTEAYGRPDPHLPLLHRRFARKARLHPFRMLIADTRSGALSGIKTFAATVILARKLKLLMSRDEEMVGILLPQSVGGTLANIALMFLGKIPVNLNYTASNEAIAAAARQCKMKHVITSKAFLEQVPVDVPGTPIYMEDVMKTVEKRDRIVALLLAAFCPVKILERSLGAPPNRTSDELATVVFSSGSEGEPKGVMLSHYNISKNIDGALLVFPHKNGDCIVGMLPFFHSFGFTATLWLVLTTSQFSAVYHPNPLEARAIGELVQKYGGTIMFSTSTFLHGFIRRCTPEQLKSLRCVITGAEKLAPRVRDAFKEKFGVEPLEGYGTTECAPIVSLNLPDVRAPGFYLKGTKRGSIGLPLPGISVRIIDPDSREVLQNGKSGLLMVKGPNIMRGYLDRPDKTAQVLQDGWYETGDISTIDEDGFITITDRLARFSKIAGEMVSHTKIEEELQKVIDEPERKFAVAGVPDENKGERLVVLHTLTDDEFELMLGKLGDIDLPNLWIPKSKAFYKVDQIPVLGTGKMDLKAVKELARKLDVGE